MSGIKILPCPFCGNEEILPIEKFTGSYRFGKPVYILFAECSLCGASSKAKSFTFDNDEEAEFAARTAANAWNRRFEHLSEENLGKWEVELDGYAQYAMCSECQNECIYEGNSFPFCPFCGSHMDKEVVFY